MTENGNLIEKAVDACQRGDERVLDECLAEGLDPKTMDIDNCSLLHWAAINNKSNICEKLISLGADPNILGGILQSSPLHWAVRTGQISSSVVLVRAGAVCNVRDTQGYTPLHLAVQNTHIALTAYLLAKFPDTRDFPDNAGMTAVMWAAYRCYQLFPLRLLIDCGASLDVQESLQGNTALHYAVQERNALAVQELLKAGADPTIKNNQHETPMDIAANNRNQRIQKLLQKALRKRNLMSTSFLDKLKDDENTLDRVHFAVPFIGFGSALLYFQFMHCLAAALLTLITCGILKYAVGDLNIQHSTLPVGVTVVEPLVMLHAWICYVWAFVPWYLQILFFLSVITVFVSLLLIYYGDPGRIQPSKEKMATLVDGIENGSLTYFCFTCFVNRPPFAKHCSVCDHCVRDFDHHCPWLAQCVTMKNIRLFLVFVASVLMCSFVYALACLLFVISELRGAALQIVVERYGWIFITGILAGFHIFFMGTLFTVQCMNMLEGETTNSRIKRGRSSNASHGHGHSHFSLSRMSLCRFCAVLCKVKGRANAASESTGLLNSDDDADSGDDLIEL